MHGQHGARRASKRQAAENWFGSRTVLVVQALARSAAVAAAARPLMHGIWSE
jgi:hypothetical protein